MKKLGSFLAKKSLKRSGPLDEQSVFFVFRDIIKREYGRQGSQYIKPKMLKGNRLIIHADSSAWANEIWLNKAYILAQINKELGSEELTDIALN